MIKLALIQDIFFFFFLGGWGGGGGGGGLGGMQRGKSAQLQCLARILKVCMCMDES